MHGTDFLKPQRSTDADMHGTEHFQQSHIIDAPRLPHPRWVGDNNRLTGSKPLRSKHRERERERAKDCLPSDRKVVESFVNQAEQSVMCLVLLDDRRVLRLCVDFTELSTCFNTPSHFIRFQNARCSRQFLPPISMQGDGCQISRSGKPRRWFGQLLSL